MCGELDGLVFLGLWCACAHTHARGGGGGMFLDCSQGSRK